MDHYVKGMQIHLDIPFPIVGVPHDKLHIGCHKLYILSAPPPLAVAQLSGYPLQNGAAPICAVIELTQRVLSTLATPGNRMPTANRRYGHDLVYWKNFTSVLQPPLSSGTQDFGST